jgi:hypothetical protein
MGKKAAIYVSGAKVFGQNRSQLRLAHGRFSRCSGLFEDELDAGVGDLTVRRLAELELKVE